LARLNRLAAALAGALSLTLAAGAHAAGPDPDRVWITFKPGAQAPVERALQAAGARMHHRFDGLRAFAVSLPPAAQEALRRRADIEAIEPDHPRYPMAQVQPYGIAMVQAPQVWPTTTGGNGIDVCVIDSGIHAAHEDFAGLSLSGYASPGQSWNTDTCGHGSHVAGTIAARDNTSGVVGVAKGNVGIVSIKVFDGASCGWSYSSTLVNAAQRCQALGAKVINMSLGGGGSSTTERNAFQSLYDQGMLSIAAAGNGGTTQLSYPASYDSVVSVAAIDSSKALASFSQRNSQVELAAPGVGVLSTVPQVSATLTSGGSSFIVAALDGSVQRAVSGALADGGRCTASGAWSGRVVLCERGDISFGAKVTNAAAGGAAGVVIYNNVDGGFSGTLGSTSAIPAVSAARADGLQLLGALGAQASLSTVPDSQGNGYAYYDGTSMATPHVAGVAALVWSANPAWTNVQIRQALAATAEDLGSAGRDTSFGWGLVQAGAALSHLQGGGGGGGEVTARVGDLTLTTTKTRRNFSTVANAQIVDAGSGAALSGASVTGFFSGAVSGCSTGTTNGSGQVSFVSGNYRSGSVSFCVTWVGGAGVAVFDPTGACRP
jgi:subtilisin family serine protease